MLKNSTSCSERVLNLTSMKGQEGIWHILYIDNNNNDSRVSVYTNVLGVDDWLLIFKPGQGRSGRASRITEEVDYSILFADEEAWRSICDHWLR